MGHGMWWRKWIPTVRLWYAIYTYMLLKKIGKSEEWAKIASWDAGHKTPSQHVGEMQTNHSQQIPERCQMPQHRSASQLSQMFYLSYVEILGLSIFLFFELKITWNITGHSSSVDQPYAAVSFLAVIGLEIWHIFEVKHWGNTVSWEGIRIFGENVLILSQIKPLAASPSLFHPQLCKDHRGSLCLYMLFLVILAQWPKRAVIIHPQKGHYTQTVEFMQSSWTLVLFLLSVPLINCDNKW